MIDFERTRPAYRLFLPILALALLAAPARSSTLPPSDPAEPPEEQETEPEEPRLEVDWYGYLKLDASWDESLVESGNFARWVASPSVVEEHSHFNMTARQSRLGVNVTHETGGGPPIRAKVEVDFYGGGAENKNRPQLRHAYFDVLWPEKGWLLRAGQTSDVISPLVPSTVNYTVAWWVGNIGYRRPMMRLEKTLASDGGAETRMIVALSRTIGDDFGAPEPGDSGVDSGVPTLQVAASRSWPVGGGRNARFGLSGHWGEERLEETLGQPVPEFASWSANLDLVVPLGAGALKAEAWTGENLDDYFGGIGQGVNFGRELEIEATGGWLAYESRFREGLKTAVGYGLDDPEDKTLPAGARSRNQAVWANMMWDFRPALTFGVEASHWRTEYLDLEDAESFRLQTALVYSFP